MSRALGAGLLFLLLFPASWPFGCRAVDSHAGAGSPLADAEVAELFEVLREGRGDVLDAALARIESAPDRRFIGVLIELVRASQLGIAARADYNRRIVALERLTGQSLGGDWFQWAEWYAGTDFETPPGFTSWKGQLFSVLDERYATILRDEHPRTIRAEEIDWGGVPVDGIPPLEQPRFVSADEGDAALIADEPVFGLTVEGDARAYPLRILDWHELVNDVVGGVPISLSYCALCGSGIAYEGHLKSGEPALTFGTSGLLYRSNKLMLDRGTGTLWSQLTGRPVLGPLASEDLQLRARPMVVTAWSDWKKRHPDTKVLSIDTGFERSYTPGEPYGSYFGSMQKLFPVPILRNELPEKERVYGMVVDGKARAWSLDALVASGVTNDQVAGAEVTLVAGRGRIQVEGSVDQVTVVSYDAGAAVRSYRTRGAELRRDGNAIVDASGAPWQLTEDALIGPDGERAERMPGTLAYWFAWQSFHPETELGALLQ